MMLSLDWREDQVRITETVVEAAGGNGGYAKYVMSLLLDRRNNEIRIRELVVKAETGNRRYARVVMMLLLDRRGQLGPNFRGSYRNGC